MAWRIEFSPQARTDLSLIFDHLYKIYSDMGAPSSEAYSNAASRIKGIEESARALESNPYRGTLREAFGPNVRNITIKKAIIWFQVNEDKETVRILAFFFGAQDHIRHMLRRLLNQ